VGAETKEEAIAVVNVEFETLLLFELLHVPLDIGAKRELLKCEIGIDAVDDLLLLLLLLLLVLPCFITFVSDNDNNFLNESGE